MPELSRAEAFSLEGETALITGGGTGLGFGIASALVACGARVVLTGRRERVLAEAVSALGPEAVYEVHDINQLAAAGSLIERISSRVGPVSILVNNAGVHLKKPFLETSESGISPGPADSPAGFLRDQPRRRWPHGGEGPRRPNRMLMVDANQGLTLERALRLVRRVEDCHLDWLEEPFPKNDLESYARLAAATEIPLAAGEREFGLEPFRRMANVRSVAIMQPDLLRVGGVTGWRLVAGLAEAHLLRVAPHFYREYDVHLAAAQPNLVAIESFDWLSDLLGAPFEVRDGLAVVPEPPGFGVNFLPEAIREFRVQA